MAYVKCSDCGNDIRVDTYNGVYEGPIACEKCKARIHVSFSAKGAFTKRETQDLPLDDIKELWNDLIQVEQNRIRESSLCFGVGAYTASEIMALQVLESLLRRRYNLPDKMLKDLINEAEKDKNLSDLIDIFSYFHKVRNKLAHPDKISHKEEAETTFVMMKRFIVDLLKLKRDKK